MTVGDSLIDVKPDNKALCVYINFLLLSNKSPPKLSNLREKKLWILQFWWVRNLSVSQLSGLSSLLSGRYIGQDMEKSGSLTRAQESCSEMADSYELSAEGQLSHSCWQKPLSDLWQGSSVPCHMDHSISLLSGPCSIAADFPQSKTSRKESEEKITMLSVLEVTHHHFHHASSLLEINYLSPESGEWSKRGEHLSEH